MASAMNDKQSTQVVEDVEEVKEPAKPVCSENSSLSKFIQNYEDTLAAPFIGGFDFVNEFGVIVDSPVFHPVISDDGCLRTHSFVPKASAKPDPKATYIEIETEAIPEGGFSSAILHPIISDDGTLTTPSHVPEPRNRNHIAEEDWTETTPISDGEWDSDDSEFAKNYRDGPVIELKPYTSKLLQERHSEGQHEISGFNMRRGEGAPFRRTTPVIYHNVPGVEYKVRIPEKPEESDSD